MAVAKLYLERHEVEKLRAAAFRSKVIGFPFTHFVTINLGSFGYAPLDCPKTWQSMQQAMRRLHRRMNLPFVIAWVFERQETGVHVHFLVYLGNRTGREYRPLLLSILRLNRRPVGAINIKQFYRRSSWQWNMNTLLDYMCKGIRPEHSDMIGRAAVQQGFIIGKRYGFTRNLAPSKVHKLRDEVQTGNKGHRGCEMDCCIS